MHLRIKLRGVKDKPPALHMLVPGARGKSKIDSNRKSKCAQVVSQLICANRAITRTMGCCVGGKQPVELCPADPSLASL
jgi:hypothetical protein